MKIKCAAIKFNGKIYEGKSHWEIGSQMIKDGVTDKIPYGDFGDAQGFVTECGKYVMRTAAMSIAIRAGQVIPGRTINERELFSEDLNKDLK